MSLVEQQEVIDVLGDRFIPIREAIWQGWAEWLDMSDRHRAALTRRARSDVVHDFIVEHAATLLPDAAIFDCAQLKLFVFQSRFALRFKKLDRRLRTSNQPTGQVTDFRRQQPIQMVPAVHNLEAGYVLDKAGQDIESLHLVCPNGPGVYWDIDLTSDAVSRGTSELFSVVEKDEEESNPPVRFQTKKDDRILPFPRQDERRD